MVSVCLVVVSARLEGFDGSISAGHVESLSVDENTSRDSDGCHRGTQYEDHVFIHVDRLRKMLWLYFDMEREESVNRSATKK